MQLSKVANIIRGLDKEQRFFNMNYKEAEQFMLDWKIDD